MTSLRSKSCLAIVAAIALLVAGHAEGAIATLGVNTTFSGTDVSTGWLQVQLDDFDSKGTVAVTMSALNLPAGAFVSQWYFNFNPDASLPTASWTSGLTANSVQTGADAFKADGDGWFDILITFPNQSQNPNFFANGSSSTYTFTAAGIDVGNFLTGSENSNQSYLIAAHVQGTAGGSSWVQLSLGVDPSTAVPEPTSLAVWSVLAGSAAGLAVHRRRRKAPVGRWSPDNRASILAIIESEHRV